MCRLRPGGAPLLDPAPGVVVLLLIALAAYGCPHAAPYYRDRAARWAGWVPDADVSHRLLLIGDAGDPDPEGEPSLLALVRQVNRIPKRTTVVFLGDNVYERGMPPPAPPADELTEAAVEVAKALVSDVFQTREQAERVLNAQVAAVRGNHARAIFVPGNHDWDQFQSGGRERILAQESFLQAVRDNEKVDATLLPPGGCPGPVSVPLGDQGALIVLDTQWWVETRDDEKVGPEHNPSGCAYVTEQAVQDALVEMLAEAAHAGRRTIVVGHHPLATKGAHGGFVDPWTHVFPALIGAAYVPVYVEWLPLPVVGSAVVGLRWCCSPSAQDMPNSLNRRMRSELMRPMIAAARQGVAPLAYAGGHDHDLQVFESADGPAFLLVSGLGSSARASPVGSNRRTLFAHSNSERPGFMQIDFLDDGRVRLAVIESAGADVPLIEAYSTFLTDAERARRPVDRRASGRADDY
jgi:hypothetical protein